ncbi:hypothetical protein [Sphingobacterium lactis]|uniref:Lipoprotein n=1 Tax=Sphingobacterium lactis TaxID=797291 RepID=A0A1H5YIU8_9SPHI|nr:hypothetical protein [Sphingobacterium lactis]SEG24053.1 hypothetical protein SAMN05421877_10622 [Sphingobacterium lactis]
MFKYVFNYLLILVCCLSLTSCFDIVEEINLKTNGSGSIQGTLNLSKSRTKAASLMKLDKIDGFKIPSEAEIRREMATVVRLLQNTKGISNVKHTLDFKNYIASISCDFQNVQALNAYTATLAKHFKSNLNTYSNYSYNAGSKSFVRTYKHNPDATKEFNKLRAENQKSFDQAYYTSIYRFQDHVQKQNNGSGKISPNKQAVMVKVSIPSLARGTTNLANTIQLK